MAERVRITVALPPGLASAVRQAVDNGEYASVSAVVDDALRGWSDRWRGTKIAAMQRLVDEAEASGISPRTTDEIWAEAKRRAGLVDES